MDKYYAKAHRYFLAKRSEEAITTFLAGLDRGHVKCAYGIIRTVMNLGSYTMSYDEAISIFDSSFSSIKLLAEEGDTEAMVIVAEGMRYGFVDCDDEPYFFWLTKAAELGDADAAAILAELDALYSPIALPPASSSTDGTASVALTSFGGCLDLTFAEGIEAEDEPVSECVLIDEPDWLVYEELGIGDYLREQGRQYELRKCRDDLITD